MKVKYLVIMDMDGTITYSNSWKDLHEHFGTLEKARKNKELYLQGKITFQEWVERDIGLWNAPLFEEVKNVLLNYKIREGFEEFCSWLRSNTVFVILSCGIDIRANDIKKRYELHEAYATNLVIENGKVVSGRAVIPLEKKSEAVKMLKEKYEPELTICIGDTEFDKDMLKNGDIGIAVANPMDCADFHVQNFHEVIKIIKSLGKM